MRIHTEFLAVVEAFYYLFSFGKKFVSHIYGAQKKICTNPYNEKSHVNAERQGCSTSSWFDLT